MGRKPGKQTGILKRIAAKKRWNEGDARAVMEAWQEGGLSLAEFCRRNGIGPWRLGQWKKRLGHGSGEAPPRFVPVRLVHNGVDASPSMGIWVEIVLPDGVRIRAGDGFDAGKLAELVSALGRASC
jgi:hypothetical protein